MISASKTQKSSSGLKVIFAAAFLLVLTGAVYFQVKNFDFIHYDDNPYVFENPYIRGGLNFNSVRWAFSAGLLFQNVHCDYWQPLTFISRALDIQLFGLNPAAHHLENLFFHILNTLILFLLLNRLTRAPGKSFIAALIFAVHPVQIEAVAWVTARKDLLSVFFSLLCLTAYVRFRERDSKFFYGISLFLYLCVILAKPVFMLPVFLLLLDFWPLEKKVFTAGKMPFFFLSALGLILLKSPLMLPPSSAVRFLERALLGYPHYLRSFFWPLNVGIYGPVPPAVLPLYQGIVTAALLALFSGAVFLSSKKSPYLFMGWFWFFAGLLPVVWTEWEADRFMYLPIIGLSIAVIWETEKALKNFSYGKKAGIFLACAAAAILIFLNASQLGYWKNDEKVFTRALEINPKNFGAHNNLGIVLLQQGEMEPAREHFLKTRELNPNYLADIGLGVIAEREMNIGGAMAYYKEGVRLHPQRPVVYFNLANMYYKTGNLKEAARLYQEALRRDPLYDLSYIGLGNVYGRLGQWPQAAAFFYKALAINPGSEPAKAGFEKAQAHLKA